MSNYSYSKLSITLGSIATGIVAWYGYIYSRTQNVSLQCVYAHEHTLIQHAAVSSAEEH